jgi:hypothetical protein
MAEHKWKQFETLVAKIQQDLSGEHAVVTLEDMGTDRKFPENFRVLDPLFSRCIVFSGIATGVP